VLRGQRFDENIFSGCGDAGVADGRTQGREWLSRSMIAAKAIDLAIRRP
jgi:hypothetical protein